MAYNEDSSASGHDEPWIQWYEERSFNQSPLSSHDGQFLRSIFHCIAHTIASLCHFFLSTGSVD